MAAIFAGVKNALIAAEGGYSNKANDYGGETNWGVSKRYYPHLDIKKLTFEEACAKVYIPDYWNRYRLSEINSQDIANKIFLTLINMNPLEAVEIVQRALLKCGAILEIDGVLGSKTIREVNSVPSRWFLDSLRVEQCFFYVEQVRKDKSQLGNLEGWIRRALR
jgi:lysozyme family protein